MSRSRAGRRPPDPGSLRRNRRFQLLCAGQGLSMLGSGASGIALPLLVLHLTHSPLRVGLVEAVWTGALALACLPAGPLVDRLDRRTVLLTCEAGRALTSAALAAAILTGHATPAVLLAAGVLLGFLTAPFNAAGLASVRQVVPERKLSTALAVNQVRGQLAFLLGPVVGGLLFQVSPSAPFWLDAASYVISAACVLALGPALYTPAGEREGWWRSFTTGLRFLWRERLLRRLTLVASAQNFVLDGVYLAVVVSCARQGASGLSVGMLTAASAVGAMTGVVLAPRVGHRFTPDRVLLATEAMCALLVGAMALGDSELVLAVLLAGCALAVAVSGSVLTVARLLRTPERLQGRANSAIGLLFMATPPLGSALAGALVDRLPDAAVFLFFGALLGLLALALPRERAFAAVAREAETAGSGAEAVCEPRR
ncbi:MFS transporter [Streptomyces olivoreticuli]|uniref:MFS transporter n=1 Tax=Streptomyces olivoreticuli TaxID=68246 RepID=UPI002658D5F7|nr:MFS transporter [Streptomyces olivoreticuli]WKK24838.1 MFS transporter [Streptomyces olivoreticuli]